MVAGSNNNNNNNGKSATTFYEIMVTVKPHSKMENKRLFPARGECDFLVCVLLMGEIALLAV